MPTRRWVLLGWIGYGMVLLVIFTVCLVLFAKEQFSWLVGSMFLPAIGGMIFVGALAVLLAALMPPYRKTGPAIGVAIWALIALTSPLFGLMFLMPWSLLLLTAPLVLLALFTWWKQTAVPAETLSS
ncbi:MAG TPA: hypothetical protein VEK57_12935 [Thermoanaerobaculia bacterium]|nr:hypothetical protein [Thermoanaerobaculia bacterium]